MTDQKTCPRCGCRVSGFSDYIFIPAENLRWHRICYERTHPEPIQDQIEEEAQ